MYDPLEPRPYTAMARRFIESKFVLTGMSDLVGLEQEKRAPERIEGGD